MRKKRKIIDTVTQKISQENKSKNNNNCANINSFLKLVFSFHKYFEN